MGGSRKCEPGCTCKKHIKYTGERNSCYRHGLSKHDSYSRWYNMMSRCYKETDHDYGRYGGRGITVCEEWHDRTTFLLYLDEHLGPCPPGQTLDRIDNERGYEPGNIRWASRSEQAVNRGRTSRP